ncbi:hypothetical protein BS78_K016100 [Paspalum vaginatum]|uniref:Coilin n=2 Tax=Paspalum vaginatum TaxID=158149 RepID=A0A9W7XCC9_9POAL|nr:hypothetical protein BS78_K016100 [Paspalum vaginatum]
MATPAASPTPVRLRLVFEKRRLLRFAQRDEGLRRCWLLLPPELANVADLAAHVAARFRLRHSCPSGVVLSMDGFTLPPFESTCIFRDKDIIRVKQKSCKKLVGHNKRCSQDAEIVENKSLRVDDEILTIQYKKDVCNHQEEERDDHQPEENTTAIHSMENNGSSSKRKWDAGVAGIPESSKSKKLKVTSSGKHIDYNKDDNVYQYQHQIGTKQLMSAAFDIDAKKAMLQPETTTLVEQQKAEKNNESELKCEAMAEGCNDESDMKKLESRSARRKKIKRLMRRTTKLQTEKNVHEDSPIAADCSSPSNQDALHGPSINKNAPHVPSSSHKAHEEESDTSDEIVPVVVRPGHIRFEPVGGEPDKLLVKEIQGTFQWSRTISKKKGQKWGMSSSNKKNADIGYHGSSMEVNHHVMDSKITENGICAVINQNDDEGSNMEMLSAKNVANGIRSDVEHLDFESLYPLTRLPKEGDLIAYRLVELSSSLCPELSSYRVGKVLIYDPISLRIILLPVPEYPIVTGENKPKDESDTSMDFSPYKEDGSMEIEYSSLLDVRLLNGTEPVPGALSAAARGKGGSLIGKPVTVDKNGGNIDYEKPSLVANKTKDQEAILGKMESTVWEENSQPNDKIDVKENGWGTWKRNANTSAWSYRALRSSALGPTMAILRGKNNQNGKPSNRKYGK